MAIDLVGHVYGRLTVVSRAGTQGESALWNCQCECGGSKTTTSNKLRVGDTKSCGCAWRAVDLVGRRFGSLTVEAKTDRAVTANQDRWRCRCDCGGIAHVVTSKLTDQNKCVRCAPRRHGHSKSGEMTSTYQTWAGMKKRCYQQNCKSYKDYGARGIKVCDRWRDDFAVFLADMGERPSAQHSLDRRDNERGYSPDNCRWATKLEQARNTRATKLEAHEAVQIRWLFDEGQTATAIAKFFGIAHITATRIRDGKSWVDP